MTRKDAEIIRKWLEEYPYVRAELVLDKKSREYELRLSKKRLNDKEREFVIIGIPLSVDEELN